jgi:hypothetical protein
MVLICLLYGFIKMGIDLVRDPNISASALMALMSALLILLIGMLADGLATRVGRLHQNVLGVRTVDEMTVPVEDSEENVVS